MVYCDRMKGRVLTDLRGCYECHNTFRETSKECLMNELNFGKSSSNLRAITLCHAHEVLGDDR